MAEGSAGGQEQIPREVAVVRRRHTWSAVWENFTRFTTADGEGKAKCKNCSAEFVADTKKHGNTHLWRHVHSCRNLWEHFTRVTTADGEDKAKCNNCSAELVAHTKHLLMHVKSCSKQATDGTRGEHPPRPRAASESSNMNPDYKEAYEDLARMIALGGYDSSVVEDDHFRSFVSRLNPDFQVPSRRTIEEICDGVSDEAKSQFSDGAVPSKLEPTSGRVNLAFGTAQTVEGTVFYIAFHVIDDEWKLHKMIMGAYMVVPRCIFHGSLLGIPEICFEDEDFFDVVSRYNISTLYTKHKVFSTALGKVAFCSTALGKVAYFADALIDYMNDVFSDPSEMTPLRTTYTDDVLHSIAKRLMDHVEDTDTVYEFLEDQSLTRQERQEILSYLGLDELWTYNEHWYSFYCSLEVVHRGRSSTAAEDATRTRKKLFEETAFTELLRKLFGAICRAIQKISAPSSPTSNLCLRELFKVREVLQSALEGASGDKADVYRKSNGFDKGVAGVLKDAKCTLEKSIQDSYLEWSVPLVLDPRYKLTYITSYFNRAFGPEAEKYISNVTSKIEELFTNYSKVYGETTDGDQNRAIEMAVDNSDSSEQAREEHCRQQQQVLKELERSLLDRSELDVNESELQFDESILLKHMEELKIELKSELGRYLEEVRVPETGDFDILNWWKDNSSKYPTVARMARDALAMPTCSTTTAEQISRIRSMVRGYSKEVFKG